MTDDRGSTAKDPMEALVFDIARALVDDPERVAVETVAGTEATILRLHVSDADIGKVIGKQGRTAHSLRTILSHRYMLDIVESRSGNDTGQTERE